ARADAAGGDRVPHHAEAQGVGALFRGADRVLGARTSGPQAADLWSGASHLPLVGRPEVGRLRTGGPPSFTLRACFSPSSSSTSRPVSTSFSRSSGAAPRA